MTSGFSARYELIAAATALLAIGGFVGFLVLQGDGEQEEAATDVLAAAGCESKTFAAGERRHIAPGERVTYNTDPPSNGPHDPQPVLWGEYAEPVDPQHAVHNLEHGGVVVYYGRDVDEVALADLSGFYREDPNGIVIAPLPRLGTRMALTAWTAPPAEEGGTEVAGEGRLALCEDVDRGALVAFGDAYRGKGPERFPISQLQPGT